MEQERGSGERKNKYLVPASIAFAALVLGGAWVYTTGMKAAPASLGAKEGAALIAGTAGHDGGGAIVAQSVELPIAWGDLGVRMAEAGVLDKEQFAAIYEARGGLSGEARVLLENYPKKTLTVTQENAGALLNVLWAFGLGNKNPILEEGPMTSSQYGGAGRFASTGGWTLAKGGDAMAHYSAHEFVTLNLAQQQLVERVSQNIYRPCCDNSTYFPDCNHGMAMLGLLELLAANGATEDEMYRAALAVNSFWFPNEYATIAKYLTSKGINPAQANPKEILGKEYSSASGFQRVASLVPREENQGGGGCGV
ncbi:MAG: hypothetical protein HYW65_01080 [Candidatus Liptonbacteria bacterium]|nr:hypothetical protein [Candidatus Liptonbacteria bacterium]